MKNSDKFRFVNNLTHKKLTIFTKDEEENKHANGLLDKKYSECKIEDSKTLPCICDTNFKMSGLELNEEMDNKKLVFFEKIENVNKNLIEFIKHYCLEIKNFYFNKENEFIEQNTKLIDLINKEKQSKNDIIEENVDLKKRIKDLNEKIIEYSNYKIEIDKYIEILNLELQEMKVKNSNLNKKINNFIIEKEEKTKKDIEKNQILKNIKSSVDKIESRNIKVYNELMYVIDNLNNLNIEVEYEYNIFNSKSKLYKKHINEIKNIGNIFQLEFLELTAFIEKYKVFTIIHRETLIKQRENLYKEISNTMIKNLLLEKKAEKLNKLNKKQLHNIDTIAIQKDFIYKNKFMLIDENLNKIENRVLEGNNLFINFVEACEKKEKLIINYCTNLLYEQQRRNYNEQAKQNKKRKKSQADSSEENIWNVF